ncbi:ABC transporter permease [Methylophaga sp. OBS4]|uniref:ABC transporter permease n=1 Tax=Methylophaga sp. OBS4 TaxID=2991935 RepID=UPI00225B3546|nr:ABC transporter permease [Methylophaga sp. OBS4]MCX4188094.1 ABC transporter permease [Methylophaga sp. OBS4]
MNSSIQIIPPLNLALAFIPVALVLIVMFKWSLQAGNAIYAIIRMLIQLLLVGYILTTIFAAEQAWIVVAVMLVMVTAASWIALGTVKRKRKQLFGYAFWAIASGGCLTLILVTQGVINLEPWYEPRYMIPLAGMTFANSMISVSLAAERLQAELSRDIEFGQARNEAFRAAFIPTINSMLAVGLVSLPGMMTGQILSGVSPIVAAHYQIVVMCMIFGSAGLSTAYFLWLSRKVFEQGST